ILFVLYSQIILSTVIHEFGHLVPYLLFTRGKKIFFMKSHLRSFTWVISSDVKNNKASKSYDSCKWTRNLCRYRNVCYPISFSSRDHIYVPCYFFLPFFF